MKITPIISGYFKLDGGAMFGVVPKRLWSKTYPCDEDNMCTWAMRSLLIEDGTQKILIDTGIGNKQDDRFRSHFYPHGSTTVESLKEIGVQAEEITDVILTHLHFDHVGGALYFDQNGKSTPTYANATYWTGEEQYNWAYTPNEREKASFLKENFVPLKEEGRLKLIGTEKDAFKFCDAISMKFYFGHTHGMIVPTIHLPAQQIIYCADLLPSSAHLGAPYVMAYDIEPLKSIDEKMSMLSDAYSTQSILVMEHDYYNEAFKLELNSKGKYEAITCELPK